MGVDLNDAVTGTLTSEGYPMSVVPTETVSEENTPDLSKALDLVKSVGPTKHHKNLKFATFFSNGSVPFLEIPIWSATTKIQCADLGIAPSKDINDALNWGSEKLLNKELLAPLNNIRSSAQNLIRSNSETIDSIAPGLRFVPKTKIKEVSEVLKEYQDAFYKHVEEVILPNYEIKSIEQLEVIGRALRKATEGKPDQDKIVITALERIKNKYPSKDALKTKFRFLWKFRGITNDKTDDAVTVIDAALKESEATEAAIKEIVEGFGDRVKKKAAHIKEIIDEGGRPTEATITSLTKLRADVSSIEYMGGGGLCGVIDKLIILVNAYIKSEKDQKTAQESVLKEGANNLVNEVDQEIDKSVMNALDYFDDMNVNI